MVTPAALAGSLNLEAVASNNSHVSDVSCHLSQTAEAESFIT
jgi:hypothetical protein